MTAEALGVGSGCAALL